MSSLSFCKVESINYHFTLSFYRMYTHTVCKSFELVSFKLANHSRRVYITFQYLEYKLFYLNNLQSSHKFFGRWAQNIIVIEIPIRRSCSTKHHKYSITSDCKKQRSVGTLCPARIEFYQIKLIFINMIVSKIQLL